MKKRIPQAVLNFIFFAVVAILCVSTIRNVGKIFSIKAEIEKKKIKVARIDEENKRIEMEIAKAQSPEFIERQVRDKLGLVKEGETVVVLPEIEEVKKLAPRLDLEEDYLPDPNWRKWLKLFM